MSLYELLERFSLLIISIFVLFYFSNKRKKETINPIILIVGLCTFSLCYLFTKIEVGVGIGFGLFAIFSILRFRAQTFTINAIIFLFTTITLSILDIMYPFEKFSVLLLFQSIILGFYIFITSSFISQETKYVNSVVLKMSYENDFILDNNNIRNSIQNKININEFDFKIISIDAMTNEIEVKILY